MSLIRRDSSRPLTAHALVFGRSGHHPVFHIHTRSEGHYHLGNRSQVDSLHLELDQLEEDIHWQDQLDNRDQRWHGSCEVVVNQQVLISEANHLKQGNQLCMAETMKEVIHG